MYTIQISDPKELLAFRRQKNLELYANNLGGGNFELLVQAETGITMRSRGNISDPEIYLAVQFSNTPIYMFDERKPSHDFGDSSTWTTTSGSSECIIAPEAGKVFNVTHIQVRFPKNASLSESNKLCFQVWMWVDAYQAQVPVMDLRYPSLLDLMWEANETKYMSTNVVDDWGYENMVELEFKYCDPYTLEGAPIALHHCTGDYIRIWMEDHQPVTTASGVALTSPTWCVVNGKETYDF